MAEDYKPDAPRAENALIVFLKTLSSLAMKKLSRKIEQWSKELGFGAVGISSIDLSETEKKLHQWLAKGYQGDMHWMSSHGTKRTRPNELVEGTCSIISVRMDYFPPNTADEIMILNHPNKAYISRYALGRDYHKLMRKRLQTLAKKIADNVDELGYRVFVDSAPVMEKPIAVKAGLGWMGKHTNIINQQAGSWFFLGEIYTNLPLPESIPVSNHCGRCIKCIDICPTKAIIAPYHIDARLCISYLTIEHKGAIPVELRTQMGNRIYGCDDCQLVCPWNRFSESSTITDFTARHQLDKANLIDLFRWDEATFLHNMEGSPLRRIGYERWQRNIATALGNAKPNNEIIQLLILRKNTASQLVVEHINWALSQLKKRT